jgi:hypothetical protein
MKDPTKMKKTVSEDEDWAILPFNEAEDDKRWAKLIEETDQLEKKVAELEEHYGQKILMNEPLREVDTEDDSGEDFGDPF